MHISGVLLTGWDAYKIKKLVNFSLVDFSTLEKWQWFFETGVRLNRDDWPPTLGVVPIIGSPSHSHVDAQGVSFEFGVKMKQFSAEQDFQDILSSETKAESCMVQLAERIALFHSTIEKAGNDSSFGNPDEVWHPMKECLKGAYHSTFLFKHGGNVEKWMGLKSV